LSDWASCQSVLLREGDLLLAFGNARPCVGTAPPRVSNRPGMVNEQTRSRGWEFRLALSWKPTAAYMANQLVHPDTEQEVRSLTELMERPAPGGGAEN
jgi:hypothetical protein